MPQVFASFAALEVHFTKAAVASPIMIKQYVREVTDLYFRQVRATYGSKFKLLALAASTIAHRIKHGTNELGPDAPLVDTGALRDSVEKQVAGYTGRVGTNNPIADWHELGTSKFPPRPVWRISMNKILPATIVLRATVLPRTLGERL